MFVSDSFSVNEKGHLTIGGADALDLMAEYGSPLYVLDEEGIRRNCRLVGFKRCFLGLEPRLVGFKTRLVGRKRGIRRLEPCNLLAQKLEFVLAWLGYILTFKEYLSARRLEEMQNCAA